MSDVLFTITFKDDGSAVLKKIQSTAQESFSGVETAAKRASGGLAGMTGQMNAAGLATGLLTKAFGALTIAAVGQQFISMADTASRLAGQLALVSSSQAEATATGRALFEVAQSTRSSYESTVELYARLARAAGTLGLSQKDLTTITQTVSQAVQISGASAGAASAALLQLGQALASGVLRGDEFNSIMEQTPRVAQAIADSLGVPIGQLRAMAEQGKLTADIVIKAFQDQRAVIEAEFAKLPLTVGQSLTQLGNSLLQFVGVVDGAFGVSGALAKGFQNLSGWIDLLGEQLRRATIAEEFEKTVRVMEQLQARIKDLRENPDWVERTFGTDRLRNAEEALASLQVRATVLSRELKGTNASAVPWKAVAEGAFLAAGAYDQFTARIKKLTPEQLKVREEIDKQIASIRRQGDVLNLSGAALADYAAKEALAKGGTLAQSEAIRVEVLALESKKAATAAATKATQAQAEAARKAAAIEKQNAEDVIKAGALQKKLAQELFVIRAKEQTASVEKLHSLQEELQAAQDENTLIQASIGPKENLLEVEQKIALARIEHTRQTALAKVVESDYADAQRATVNATADLAKENVVLKDNIAKSTAAMKAAILTTGDLRDGFKEVITGIFEGSGKIGDVIENFGKGLGLKLIEGIAFGKEGLENQVLIPNFSDLFGSGGIIGSIISGAGSALGGDFIASLTSGIGLNQGLLKAGLGELFDGLASGSLDSILAGGKGVFEGLGKGISGLIGFGLAEGLKGILGIGGSKEAGLGGKIGGLIGGIGGSFFGPIGSALGSFFGDLLGSIFGGLFAHIPTKGTQIRKSIVAWLKDIKVSFADEINSKNYFFEETKALAKQMFGGDFLAASKQVLLDKAGPELARQLQALGTFLTADQAKKLGKPIEQTGTTFGNLLIHNLGIDAIPDAINEIIQKGGITLDPLIEKLNSLFKQNLISPEFFTTAIEGAVELFSQNLPAAIHVSKIALQSFADDGTLDLQKFKDATQKAVDQYSLIVQTFRSALTEKDGLAAAEAFGKGLEQGLAEIAKEAFIQDFIKNKLFEGVDLSDGLQSGEIDLLKERVQQARDAIDQLGSALGDTTDKTDGLTASASSLVDKISELNQQLADLANKRIEIRVSLAGQLKQIGALSSLDELSIREQAARPRFADLTGRISHIGTRPFGDLTIDELNEAITLTQKMRDLVVERYKAEAQAIQDTLNQRIAAINEELRQQQDAIRAEFAARRAAIEATIAGLQKQRDQTQELFQVQLDGLRKQLKVAQEFQRVAEGLKQTIASLVTGPQSTLSGSAQFAFLQRQAAAIRARLATATAAEKPALIEELSRILQQELQVGQLQKPSPEFQALFSSIIKELESLQKQAEAAGGKAASIEQQILDTELAMKTALASIDTQIAAQRDLLNSLSQQEQAALKAAADAAAVKIAAATKEAKDATDVLREAAVKKLQELADLEDSLLKEQINRLEAQKQTAMAQLEKLVGVEEASRLLAAGTGAQLLLMGDMVASLRSIDEQLGNLTPAAAGFSGVVSRPRLFLAGEHGPEQVTITPGSTSAGARTITFAPQITVTMQGSNNPQEDGERLGRGLSQALLSEWRHGPFGAEIRREIQRH